MPRASNKLGARLSAFNAQFINSPLPKLTALSAMAYGLIFSMPDGGLLSDLCGNVGLSKVWTFVQFDPTVIELHRLFPEWFLMVVAMMTPLTVTTLTYIRYAAPGNPLVAATFLMTYWSIWTISFFVLFCITIALATAVGDTADLPLALGFAIVYSCSPLAQKARNACHRNRPIRPFGAKALSDSVAQGATTSVACIGACWPWMIVPLTSMSAHYEIMIFLTFLLFAERISLPKPPTWDIPPAIQTIFGYNFRGSKGLRI